MVLDNQILETLEKEKSVYFDGAFTMDFLNELELLFLNQSGQFRAAAISKNKEVHAWIRGDFIYWLDADKHHFVFSVLHKIKEELSQYFRIALNQIEAHLAHYPADKGYNKHIDQPRNSLQKRVFSMTLYLNREWKKGDGGELLIFNSDSPDQIKQSIDPLYGRATLFFSDQVPHQVSKTFCDRKSLTLWFRHDIIP